MKILKIITIVPSLLLLLGTSQALAVTGEHVGYCDNIESTAAALECISEHKDKAEKDLETIFAKLTRKPADNAESEEEKESHDDFLKAHKDWIAYRNSECKWEAKTVDASLSKLQEISCIIKLTEERTIRLQTRIKSKESPEEDLEFSAFPRWLNGLHNDYKQVIWDVKSQINHDLNCDDKGDDIIQGVSVENNDAEIKENGDEYDIQAYIAIIDGQASGKPKVVVLNLPKECGYMPDLEYIETDMDKLKCNKQLDLSKCLHKITYDGKSYIVDSETDDTKETKTK